MKTAALSFGRWIFLGGILFTIGILTVVGAGRRRGSKSYGWRIALWALALSMMGGGTLMAAPQAKNPDSTAIDTTDAAEFSAGDEIMPKCYKPMPTCYKPMPPPPPPPDTPQPDGDKPDGSDDGDNTDDAAGDKPTPPEVMPTCYEAVPEPPPPPPPTCYAPMEPPMCYRSAVPDPPPVDPPEEPES